MNPVMPALGALTVLDGWFQSETYFSDQWPSIRGEFTFRPQVEAAIAQLERSIEAPEHERVAIHLRFGDYYTSDSGLGHPVLGWVLPPSYYRRALELLPPHLEPVILSDMPERAARWLDWLPKKRVIQGHPPAVDLGVITRCKYVVMSASTFAWWGAYLNRIPRKQIICPEYFLGWWRRCWFPDGIKVYGWTYVPVITRPDDDGMTVA
ncbi:MAG: alpha-1,2-fucosyltransferase [Bryobacterales bacterium]|nr:alpha-1,2-fucosyltransferase [Bryobacterales bacterium]